MARSSGLVVVGDIMRKAILDPRSICSRRGGAGAARSVTSIYGTGSRGANGRRGDGVASATGARHVILSKPGGGQRRTRDGN